MYYVLLTLTVSIGNILCFLIGINVAQKVNKDEEVKMPNLNPIDKIKKAKSQRDLDKELGKYNTIMKNIDSYDGTDANQEEVV